MSGRDPQALWFVGPRQVELRRQPLPAVGPDDVRVEGRASGISQGTELLLYRGEGPKPFDPSLPTEANDYPIRYGYAWVGRVTELGANVDPKLRGRVVFALASHAEAHVLRARDVNTLPESVPAERATLAANMETALTCAWDAEAALGERAVVLGGGLVGLLTAWLLARAGARVVLVERAAARRETAARLLGPRATIVATIEDEAFADVVVEATGTPAALDDAVRCAAFQGRVIVASFYGRKRHAIDLGDAFHRRRLALRASQVSSIPPRLAPRWTYARRFELVADYLTEPSLDVLFGRPIPFDDAPSFYATLAADQGHLPPAHVFVYR